MADKDKKFSKDKKREKEILAFAYTLGLIERGLKNPDSKITASHAKGMEKREKRDKKSLF